MTQLVWPATAYREGLRDAADRAAQGVIVARGGRPAGCVEPALHGAPDLRDRAGP